MVGLIYKIIKATSVAVNGFKCKLFFKPLIHAGTKPHSILFVPNGITTSSFRCAIVPLIRHRVLLHCIATYSMVK